MPSTEYVKVVARYADGRVRKGTTLNFSPDRRTFLLHPADGATPDQHEAVLLADLKALFFVRTFDGDPSRQDQQTFDRAPNGRAIAVTFRDGEVLVGATFTYDAAREGFFLFPADPRSNNTRVYVVAAQVLGVERVPHASLPPKMTVA